MTKNRMTTEDIWKQLGTQLELFLMNRVSDKQVAEDLLQETFVRIHRNLDDVTDAQRIRSWVFSIARNLIIDHYRSKSRAASEIAEQLEAAPEPEESLNEIVIGWLPGMIDQLPEGYREAVQMYELQGLSQQEIADQLGISLPGAKSRVQRGREKLKTVLFDCCSFEQDRRGNVIEYNRNHPE